MKWNKKEKSTYHKTALVCGNDNCLEERSGLKWKRNKWNGTPNKNTTQSKKYFSVCDELIGKAICHYTRDSEILLCHVCDVHVFENQHKKKRHKFILKYFLVKKVGNLGEIHFS